MLNRIMTRALPVVFSFGISCVANGINFDQFSEIKKDPKYEEADRLETPAKKEFMPEIEKSKFETSSGLPGDMPWVFAGASWDAATKGQNIDLDLNVTITSGDTIIGSVYYGNKRDCAGRGPWAGIIKKSLDDTTGKGRAGAEDEAIGVNLEELRRRHPEADGVWFSLTSYSRQAFGEVANESLDLYSFHPKDLGDMSDLFDLNYDSFSENPSNIEKRMKLTTYNLDNDHSMSDMQAVLFVKIEFVAKNNAWKVEPIGKACSVETPMGITVRDVEDDIVNMIRMDGSKI